MNDDIIDRLGAFAKYYEAMPDEIYPVVEVLITEQDENSNVQHDGAEPLDQLKYSQQIDDPLNDDSSQYSDDDSPYSPTKHQDELYLGVREEVEELVDRTEISPHVSDDDLHNAATDTIASVIDSTSCDSWSSCCTSLSNGPELDSANASKEDLPNNRSVGGTQSTNVQEPTGSSAADGNGDGEVAVNEVDHMLQAKEDRKRYSVFVKEDYSICGELLYCHICEKNVYSINPDHMKSLVHEQRLIEALNSPKFREVVQTEGWQVTADGFLRCYLCQKDYKIRTRHCFSDAHVLSKKYKTCPRIRALKLRAYELWKKLPTTIFDGLLTLRLINVKGLPAEASFCIGCCERFNTHADRERHGRESQVHLRWVEGVMQLSDPFSYSFGIIPNRRETRGYSFRYCVLCKTGMTNLIEVDNHVHGANSQHSTRVRLFWTKVIPELLESDPANAFPPPVKDTASYSLDVPPQKRLYYFKNLLYVIVISMDGYSMCSLCDEYVCDRSMKTHCDSVKHAHMYQRFLRTLCQPDAWAWGIIKKENALYCVLCHVAFVNAVDQLLHSVSVEPHLKRVELFNKFFDRFIKAAVRSLNST